MIESVIKTTGSMNLDAVKLGDTDEQENMSDKLKTMSPANTTTPRSCIQTNKPKKFSPFSVDSLLSQKESKLEKLNNNHSDKNNPITKPPAKRAKIEANIDVCGDEEEDNQNNATEASEGDEEYEEDDMEEEEEVPDHHNRLEDNSCNFVAHFDFLIA